MKKLLLPIAFFFSTGVNAQVLFTVGPDTVSTAGFLQAFQKQKIQAETGSALEEYLQLYINYRLKILAAKEAGLDKLPQQQAELKDFADQLAGQFLLDPTTMEKLREEADKRFDKEILVREVFFSSENGEAEAAKNAELFFQRSLKQKGSFYQDTTISSDRQIGYITAFSLPYPIENIVYQLKNGEYSKPVRGSRGYYIFQRITDRPALGTLSAAHILIGIAPGATDDEKRMAAEKADSLYQRLLKGDDFHQLAEKYSNDNFTYANGGIIAPFTAGTYEYEGFEKTAFELQNDGDFSQPVQSSIGFHIIKRLSLTPPSVQRKKPMWNEMLKDMIIRDSRITLARDALTDMVVRSWNMDPRHVTDSIRNAALAHYRKNLETFQPAYAAQVKEFAEGNLLFEIMQREIWDKAGADSSGLYQFYRENASRYTWKASAEVLQLTCNDQAAADLVRKKIIHNPGNWEKIVDSAAGILSSYASRVEIHQLEEAGINNLRENSFSEPQTQPDGTVLLTYVFRILPEGAPRSFEDAKGFVLNDYQQYLESTWLRKLREKYPVNLNQKEWKRLRKNKKQG